MLQGATPPIRVPNSSTILAKRLQQDVPSHLRLAGSSYLLSGVCHRVRRAAMLLLLNAVRVVHAVYCVPDKQMPRTIPQLRANAEYRVWSMPLSALPAITCHEALLMANAKLIPLKSLDLRVQ